MVNCQILPLRTRGKWRGQGQSSSNNSSTIIYFCFLWTWSKSKQKTWLINFHCDPWVLKRTHHPQPLTIKPESDSQTNCHILTPEGTPQPFNAIHYEQPNPQQENCSYAQLHIGDYIPVHHEDPYSWICISSYTEMDEANQTERCSIQVATNKFHNVLNKGNSRRTDVHCYRYERERENEGGGYWFSKTKAC